MLHLHKSERIWMSTEELDAQLPSFAVVEGPGSAMSLSAGDVGVSFPVMAYLSLDAKNAKVLTCDAFAMPLQISAESVMLKFKLEDDPIHQSLQEKRYEVYNNLTIKSRSKCGSKVHSVDALQQSWPDIRGCIQNVNVAFGFQKPIIKKPYSFTLPSFLQFAWRITAFYGNSMACSKMTSSRNMDQQSKR